MKKLSKKILVFIPVWVTYLVGDVAARLSYRFDKVEWLFNLYQNMMDYSTALEDWADSEIVRTKIGKR